MINFYFPWMSWVELHSEVGQCRAFSHFFGALLLKIHHPLFQHIKLKWVKIGLPRKKGWLGIGIVLNSYHGNNMRRSIRKYSPEISYFLSTCLHRLSVFLSPFLKPFLFIYSSCSIFPSLCALSIMLLKNLTQFVTFLIFWSKPGSLYLLYVTLSRVYRWVI